MKTTMRDSFKGVTCSQKKQVTKICLNKDCRNSPFLCSDFMNCECNVVTGPAAMPLEMFGANTEKFAKNTMCFV